MINFSSVAASSQAAFAAGAVTFTGVGTPLDVSNNFGGFFNTTSQRVQTGFDTDPDEIRIDFASAVSAIGFK